MTLRKTLITTYAAFLLVLASTPVAAESYDPASCETPSDMREYLTTEYGEEALMILPEMDGKTLVLFLNAETRTWTILDVTDDSACIISHGNEAETPMEFHEARSGASL